MKTIDTLSSGEGRLLLHDIYREFRYTRQVSGISALLMCWKICTSGSDISRYVQNDVTILHPLGFFSGSGLWMEEIVNRFYFSTINSFVYFGAAILLVLIGIRRFSEGMSDSIVIGGVIFEACMLIFMFIVMLFSPNDDILNNVNNKTGEEKSGVSDDLILEIGELSRDFAAVIIQLEQLNNNFSDFNKKQDIITSQLTDLAENFARNASPNPKMLDTMNKTNETLEKFYETVKMLNQNTEALRREEIEYSVHKELEKIFADRIIKNNEKS